MEFSYQQCKVTLSRKYIFYLFFKKTEMHEYTKSFCSLSELLSLSLSLSDLAHSSWEYGNRQSTSGMTHNKLVLFSHDIIYMNPVLLGELGYIGPKYGSLIEDN